MTVEGAGQSRSRKRFNASPPRRRAWVRDQSVDDGGLPYRACQVRIASRTHSRVRVGAIAPGWQRLQYWYASPLPPRAAVGLAAAAADALVAALDRPGLLAGRVLSV